MAKQQPRSRQPGSKNINVDGYQFNVPGEWYKTFSEWCDAQSVTLKDGVIAAVNLMMSMGVAGGWSISAPRRQPDTFAHWLELAVADYYKSIAWEAARVTGAGASDAEQARRAADQAESQERKSTPRGTKQSGA